MDALESSSNAKCLIKRNIFADTSLLPETRIHVDLSAITHNVQALKGRCRPGTALMAVVKANAYGHGALAVSRTVLASGADALAVARISEAVELRKAGIDAPILLFGDLVSSQVPWMIANDVRGTITSVQDAKRLAHAARETGIAPLKVHIKVDTGMGRLGFLSGAPGTEAVPNGKNTFKNIMGILFLEGLSVEGLYTHFANADAADKGHALRQVDRFRTLVDQLDAQGVRPQICHAANSAATIEIPDAHFDMVRPGISLYGLWPSNEVDHTLVDLKPALSITSKIIHLKAVPANFKISYGSIHTTTCPTKIATIPIGYADGYSRLLSSKGDMLVRGFNAPIVGRVCMDFTLIDVGHIPDVAVGDEVVILGRQENVEVSADKIAAHIGTINYEVVAALTGRMPICYAS